MLKMAVAIHQHRRPTAKVVKRFMQSPPETVLEFNVTQYKERGTPPAMEGRAIFAKT